MATTWKKTAFGWEHLPTGTALHGKAGAWVAKSTDGRESPVRTTREKAMTALKAYTPITVVSEPTDTTAYSADEPDFAASFNSLSHYEQQRRRLYFEAQNQTHQWSKSFQRKKRVRRIVARKLPGVASKTAKLAGCTLLILTLMGLAYALEPVAKVSALLTETAE